MYFVIVRFYACSDIRNIVNFPEDGHQICQWKQNTHIMGKVEIEEFQATNKGQQQTQDRE